MINKYQKKRIHKKSIFSFTNVVESWQTVRMERYQYFIREWDDFAFVIVQQSKSSSLKKRRIEMTPGGEFSERDDQLLGLHRNHPLLPHYGDHGVHQNCKIHVNLAKI